MTEAKKLSELTDKVLRQRIEALARKHRPTKHDIAMIQLMHVQIDVNLVKRIIDRACFEILNAHKTRQLP